jgi:DNA-binding PadR family transcriptional regulator
MNSNSEPTSFLPLKPATFHILLALADEERHGYGIMQEIKRSTKGSVKMGPGTLYGTIKRLLADGLIVESEERADPAGDDERRRYYRLTDLGRRVIALDAERLADLVGIAEAKQLLARTTFTTSTSTGGSES